MTRAVTALVFLLSLAVGASGVMAEVRIDRSETGRDLVLQVTPTAAGPWTPLENLDDAAVLNPHGDLLGDGAPGWAQLGDAVVVAWARPATSDVAIASSRGHDWSAGKIPAASGVIGVPQVAGTQRDLLVAWNVASGAGMSSAQGAIIARRGTPQSPETLTRFEFTLAGHLVGVQAIDQSFHVLTLQDGFLVDTIFFVPFPPIDPFERFDVDLGFLVDVSAPVVEFASLVAEAEPTVQSRSGVLVLTWWTAPRELSFVELDEDGPVLPVETLTAERGPERPERLVQEAIRIVSERGIIDDGAITAFPTPLPPVDVFD